MESIRIRHAYKNENFDAIRQAYYQTWLATYRTQLPNSILKKLTPTTWHPEQRWQDMQLAFNNEGKIVGVCTYGPARLASFLVGEKYIRFMFCPIISILVLVQN